MAFFFFLLIKKKAHCNINEKQDKTISAVLKILQKS